MPAKQVVIPDIGDFESVDVIEVLVASGDRVRKDDSLITLESDKATMEIPSPDAGVIRDIAVSVGDKVSRGTPILSLETEEDAPRDETAGDAGTTAGTRDTGQAEDSGDDDERTRGPARAGETPAAQRAAGSAPPEAPARPPPAPGLTRAELAEAAAGKPHASPSVRRFARELGVDLARVRGSGPKGRILREDVQQFTRGVLQQETPAGGAGSELAEPPGIDFSRFGEIETRALSRIQKISGARLQRNWIGIPHVTQFDEADITELEAFRKAQFEELAEQGVKLTLLPFVMKAAVAILRRFPQLNASLEPGGEQLIVKKYYHIGVAVDTDEGLVVPVIRDVDRKGLVDIARELGELSARARDGQLSPGEMQGGTFTISNLGGLGGTGFTPIINAPEVAILGLSRSALRPVYRNDELVPRLILPFALAYDHRIVDGADAARFTSAFGADLSDVRRILL